LLPGIVLGALLVLAALSLVCHMNPEPAVTWDNFERIQNGISEPEVQAILGGPGEMSRPFSPEDRLPRGAVRKEWHGKIMQVFVDFDENGRVIRKGPSYAESGAWCEPPRTEFCDRLRRLLPW
jgi:hypothetical protein